MLCLLIVVCLSSRLLLPHVLLSILITVLLSGEMALEVWTSRKVEDLLRSLGMTYIPTCWAG
jgi:hypothetical protein